MIAILFRAYLVLWVAVDVLVLAWGLYAWARWWMRRQ